MSSLIWQWVGQKWYFFTCSPLKTQMNFRTKWFLLRTLGLSVSVFPDWEYLYIRSEDGRVFLTQG